MSTAGKVIKCRAAVAWGRDEPLKIETIDVAPPKAHEVRVKITATGVCHTDASFLNGTIPNCVFPVIFGHEGAGIVESVGEGVTKFKPGDHVIPLYVPQCYECPACKSDKTNLCDEVPLATHNDGLMPDGTTRFSCNGQTVYHCMGTSTFSEYTVVRDISLSKINNKAPLDTVCLIGCGVSTGYGAALNTAKVEKGSTCAVWGLGGIGLAAVMGCRNAGAGKIYGIDINPSKFDIARKFGCTDFINPNDFESSKLREGLMKITNGGFDYAFECCGSIIATRAMFESLNKNWGKAVIIGISSLEKQISLFPIDFVTGRTLTGSYFGGWKGVDSVPLIVEEYLNKKILLDEFITHRMSLDEINDALTLMKEGKSIRSVVTF